MKVRRKSLWLSKNAKHARKFANMRAAKERLRLARLAAPVKMPDTSAAYQPPRLKPLFVVTIRCRDGACERIKVYDAGTLGICPTATRVGLKVACIVKHYRPAKP